MHIPSQTYRPRIPETIVRSEHRCTIVTIIEIQQITVIIRISPIDIETGRTFLILTVFRFSAIGIAIGKGRSSKQIFRKTICRITVHCILITTEIKARYGIHHMFVCEKFTKRRGKIPFIYHTLCQRMSKQSFLIFSHIIKL